MGATVLVSKRNTLINKRKISEENESMTERHDDTKDIAFKSIAEGNVAIPRLEDFQKLLSFEETVGSRFTMSQG